MLPIGFPLLVEHTLALERNSENTEYISFFNPKKDDRCVSSFNIDRNGFYRGNLSKMSILFLLRTYNSTSQNMKKYYRNTKFKTCYQPLLNPKVKEPKLNKLYTSNPISHITQLASWGFTTITKDPFKTISSSSSSPRRKVIFRIKITRWRKKC